MQRLMKELAWMGCGGNKMEYVTRMISTNKAGRDLMDKLNIQNIQVTYKQTHEKPSSVENIKIIKNIEREDNHVLFHDVGDKGLITLNRPESLNALDRSMCKKMTTTLKKWQSSKKLVIIKGVGDKAFCCGGDLNILKSSRPGQATAAINFFFEAYRLYQFLGSYDVPTLVLMNNITMGGGAGISLHNKYKVITERSIFAMPEVSIGFFPDGGCTYVLPRLRNQLGLFLGLTGYRLKGTDLIHAGLATHYVPAERLKNLEQELLSSDGKNVDEILEKYRGNIDESEFSLAPYIDKIDTCFAGISIEEIIKRLQNDESNWSKNVTKILEKMSPTSLKITFHALREGKKLTLDDCIKMEYRLAYSLVQNSSDFYDGYKTIVKDKGRTPMWQPRSLKNVTSNDVLERFVIPSECELTFENKYK